MKEEREEKYDSRKAKLGGKEEEINLAQHDVYSVK